MLLPFLLDSSTNKPRVSLRSALVYVLLPLWGVPSSLSRQHRLVTHSIGFQPKPSTYSSTVYFLYAYKKTCHKKPMPIKIFLYAYKNISLCL